MSFSISADKIKEALQKAGFAQISIADEFYVLPTEKAIENFGNRYMNFLWKSNLSYVTDIWDCDDFALAAKTFANIDNAVWREETNNQDCAVAFGIAWGELSEGGGHAVNAAINQTLEGELVLKLYEPQVGQNNLGETICFKELPLDYFASLSWCYF